MLFNYGLFGPTTVSPLRTLLCEAFCPLVIENGKRDVGPSSGQDGVKERVLDGLG